MSATCRRHDTECRQLGTKTTRRHPTFRAKLLDKYAQRDEDDSSTTACDDSSNNNNVAASTHQFVMFLQSHNGECSVTNPKSTGSSSSLGFNGSQIPLLPEEILGSPVTALWRECELGHRVNMLAWDISCSELVPFQ